MKTLQHNDHMYRNEFLTHYEKNVKKQSGYNVSISLLVKGRELANFQTCLPLLISQRNLDISLPF